MSRYQSDDEQVEALKQWWQKNGTALLSGLLVVALAWTGWTYYQTQKMNQAMMGSSTFEVLQNAMDQGQFAEVAREGLKFMEEHPESPYSVGIALLEAKYHYDKQEVEEAVKHLNWVVTHSADASLRLVAQLRLVYVHLDSQQLEQAEQQLSAIASDALSKAEQANLAFAKAQVALAQQQSQVAFDQLSEVVNNLKADANLINLAQLQLDDLAKPVAE